MTDWKEGLTGAGLGHSRIGRRDMLKLSGGAALGGLTLLGCGTKTAATPKGASTVTVVTAPTTPQPTLPHQGPTTVSYPIRGTLYETLLGFDPVTGKHDIPLLATSWTHTPDFTTWTLKLRRGVQFHRGAGEMTSTDVKFSVELLMRKDSVVTAEFFGPIIRRIDTPDARTVVFHLTQPTILTDLLTNLDSNVLITSKSYFEQVGDEKAAAAPVGTGPYVLTKYTPGQGYAFARFANYWGTKPDFARLNLRYVEEDATRLAMLQSGEADITDLPKRLIADAKGAGLATKAGAVASVGAFFWFGSMDKPGMAGMPWEDIRVRQALNLAVDRKGLASGILGNLAEPMAFHLLGPRSPGAQQLARQPYPFDVAKAKELMAVAGHPNGFEMTLRPYPLAGIPEYLDITQAVAAQWSALGVRTKIEPIEQATFTDALRSTGAQQYAFPGRTPYNAFSPGSLVPLFYSSKGTWGGVGKPDSDTLDKLSGQLAGTADAAKRAALFAQIGQVVYDGYWNIPLVAVKAAVAYNPKTVKDWNGSFFRGFDGLTTMKSS